MADLLDELVEARARAICKSRKFETGEGTCAAICMDQLGIARDKCPHVADVHGDLARATIEADRKLGLALVPYPITNFMHNAAALAADRRNLDIDVRINAAIREGDILGGEDG